MGNKEDYITIKNNINHMVTLGIIAFTVMMGSIAIIVYGCYYANDSINNFTYKTFNGWIISYNSYYNPTDGYYHLDMNGEKSNGDNCTYYNYYVGTEDIMNIIISDNMNKQIR